MDNKFIGNEKNILFYNDEEGNTKVEVLLENEDVWLNTEALAALFNVKRPAITKHINNIYEDEELEERSTCSKMEHMGNNGKQVYNTKYYNLDMIISIGFRVNSKKAIKFRTWANKIIKDYVVQGFALNDERFLKAKKPYSSVSASPISSFITTLVRGRYITSAVFILSSPLYRLYVLLFTVNRRFFPSSSSPSIL